MQWFLVLPLLVVGAGFASSALAEDNISKKEKVVVVVDGTAKKEALSVQQTLESALGKDLPDLPEELKNLTPEEIEEFIEAERAEAAAKSGGSPEKDEASIAAAKKRAERRQSDKEYFANLRVNLKIGAEKGDTSAMYYYARFLDMDEKYRESDTWMKKAAEEGNEDAKIYLAAQMPGYALGLMSKNRDDRDAAYKNFTLAANDGHVEAQFHLGVMYDEDGDNLTAIEWYKKAAVGGHPGAQAILDMTEKYE